MESNFLIVILIIVAIFFALRKYFLWFFGISEIIKLLKDQNEILYGLMNDEQKNKTEIR